MSLTQPGPGASTLVTAFDAARSELEADALRGAGGRSALERYSDRVDAMLRQLFTDVAPLDAQVAVLALGGYGRRHLCLQSDIDLLVLFGGALLEMLRPLDAAMVVFAVLALFVVRPVAGWVGLAGTGLPRHERALLGFFGIRGLGSFYYLAYALNHAEFADADRLWAVVSLIVLASITVHGTTVTPLMRAVDQRRTRGRPALQG